MFEIDHFERLVSSETLSERFNGSLIKSVQFVDAEVLERVVTLEEATEAMEDGDVHEVVGKIDEFELSVGHSKSREERIESRVADQILRQMDFNKAAFTFHQEISDCVSAL